MCSACRCALGQLGGAVLRRLCWASGDWPSLPPLHCIPASQRAAAAAAADAAATGLLPAPPGGMPCMPPARVPDMVSCCRCTGCCSRPVSCCLAAAVNRGAAVPARLPRPTCYPVCCYRWSHQAAVRLWFLPRSGAWWSWSASWACPPQCS